MQNLRLPNISYKDYELNYHVCRRLTYYVTQAYLIVHDKPLLLPQLYKLLKPSYQFWMDNIQIT